MNISEFALKQGEYLDFIQKELEQGLSCGIYKGEDNNNFQPFLEDYRMKMNNLGGERNEKMKEILEEMQRRSDEFDPLLSLIECDSNDQIKKILWNLETKNPFEIEMRTLNNFQKKQRKIVRDIKDLSDPTSRIFCQIFEGKKKRYLKILKRRKTKKEDKEEETEGEEGEEVQKEETEEESIMTDDQIREYISNIVERKKENLQKSKDERESLWKKLNEIPKFVQFQELLAKIEPFETEWKEAEMKVGAESNQNGEDLESEKTIGTAIRFIIQEKMKTNLDDVVILKNCDWVSFKNKKKKLLLVGEVDVVILDKKSGKVISLVECKARCFDIAAGSRQSSLLHRRKKGKLGLRLSEGEIQEIGDVPVYIITCIQENEYILKFESSLKEDLYDLTYKRSIRSEHAYTTQEIFDILKPKYEDIISPLEWFKKYSKDFLVVVQ